MSDLAKNETADQNSASPPCYPERMTPEQADAAYDAAVPIPITPEEVERLVSVVTCQRAKEIADSAKRCQQITGEDLAFQFNAVSSG